MRLLLQHIRRGDYEIWALSRHAWESLPDTLALVIHTQSADAIRGMLLEVDADLKREEAAASAASARRRRGSSSGGSGGSGASEEEAQKSGMVVLSR
jgi:hypothetical protein